MPAFVIWIPDSQHNQPLLWGIYGSFKNVLCRCHWSQWVATIYRVARLLPEAYSLSLSCVRWNFSAKRIHFNLSVLLCLPHSTEFEAKGEVIGVSVKGSDQWPVTALNFAMETDGLGQANLCIHTHTNREMEKRNALVCNTKVHWEVVWGIMVLSD